MRYISNGSVSTSSELKNNGNSVKGDLVKLEEVVLLGEVPSSASGEECNCTHWKSTFRVSTAKKDLIVKLEPAVSCHEEHKVQNGLH